MTTPAFAAGKYFVTVDTVGNCSGSQGEHGKRREDGAWRDRRLWVHGGCQEIFGRAREESKCKGVVE